VLVIRGAFPEAMVGIYALGVARVDRPLVLLMVVQEGVEVQAADSPHPAGQHLRHLLRPLRHQLLLHLRVAKRKIQVLIGACRSTCFAHFLPHKFCWFHRNLLPKILTMEQIAYCRSISRLRTCLCRIMRKKRLFRDLG
jgi:hypothetical protein